MRDGKYNMPILMYFLVMLSVFITKRNKYVGYLDISNIERENKMEILFLISGLEILLIMTFRILT